MQLRLTVRTICPARLRASKAVAYLCRVGVLPAHIPGACSLSHSLRTKGKIKLNTHKLSLTAGIGTLPTAPVSCRWLCPADLPGCFRLGWRCAGPGRPVAPCPKFLLPDRLRPLHDMMTLRLHVSSVHPRTTRNQRKVSRSACGGCRCAASWLRCVDGRGAKWRC